MRILIADDHALFRQALRSLLADVHFDVVGEAADGTEAVQLANTLHPDVVLMDIGMPGLSSFDATRLIKKAHPETKVLFVSMYDERDFVRQAMNSGASGYLLKDTPASDLVTAIWTIAKGGTHMTPRMLSTLMNDLAGFTTADRSESRTASLTGREQLVLKLLAEGQSVKQIATELNLSVKTVQAHTTNMMRKLDLHNRSQIVRYAVQHRIIQVDVRES